MHKLKVNFYTWIFTFASICMTLWGSDNVLADFIRDVPQEEMLIAKGGGHHGGHHGHHGHHHGHHGHHHGHHGHHHGWHGHHHGWHGHHGGYNGYWGGNADWNGNPGYYYDPNYYYDSISAPSVPYYQAEPGESTYYYENNQSAYPLYQYFDYFHSNGQSEVPNNGAKVNNNFNIQSGQHQ